MLMENKLPLNEEAVRRHIEHLRRLDDEGKMVLSGPFTDYGGGMVVIRAESREEADGIFRADPFVSEGYKTYEVRTLAEANRGNGFDAG